MGTISEFSFPVRLFLRSYRWRRIDPVPWQGLEKPLAESRLALVSSAGFVTSEQEPFDAEVRGGNYSYRLIPAEIDPRELIDCQKSESYDHEGVRSDPNLAFPIDRVRELAERGRIGSLSRHHLSFMGSITAPGRLVRDTAPRAAACLVDDEVDVVVLVPV